MRISGVGHALFGIAVAGLAGLSLVYGSFAPILGPFPPTLPCQALWAYGPGIVLLAASAGIFFARATRVSFLIIAAYGMVWVAVRVRSTVLDPMSVGSWYGVGEAMGPLLGAWILYSLMRRRCEPTRVTAMTGDRSVKVAQLLFGASCVAYGAAHFAYASYTAAMVPAWLPARTALAYGTGACHAAAGFGLLLGILPRLAATLEAAMMSLFGVLVWLPCLFAHPAPKWAPTAQIQWSETFLTLLLAAAAWIVAASLGGDPWGLARSKRS